MKKKLLLHVCCASCGAYVLDLLKDDYDLTIYYYNPSIYPEAEYEKRLKDVERITEKFEVKLIVETYDHDSWLKKIKGHEQDREKGERCAICYYDRLKKTAQKASSEKINYFSTTLSISPHKSFEIINKMANDLVKKYDIKFLEQDFKKKDGFVKSVKLSKKLKLYRQNYCGCEFSKR